MSLFKYIPKYHPDYPPDFDYRWDKPPANTLDPLSFEEAEGDDRPAAHQARAGGSNGSNLTFWKEVFAIDRRLNAKDNGTDLYHYRIRVVWRIVRELAMTLGHIRPCEPIRSLHISLPPRPLDFLPRPPQDAPPPPTEDAPDDPLQVAQYTVLPGFENSPDPFHEPFSRPITNRSALDTTTGFQLLSEHHRVREQLIFLTGAKVGYGPPKYPFDTPNTPPPNYDPYRYPTQDRDVILFIDIISTIAKSLRIEEGSPDDPDQGRLGMWELDDPTKIRERWPSWEDVCLFEQYLVEETLDIYASRGETSTRKYLFSKYGYQQHEIKTLLLMSRQEVHNRVDLDVQTQKAMAVKRLENYIDRTREACNLGMEMRGMKELHQVVGLGKVAPEDAQAAFAEAITYLATERRAAEPRPIEIHVPRLQQLESA